MKQNRHLNRVWSLSMFGFIFHTCYILLFLCLPILLCAQREQWNSTKTAVYRITNDEARRLLTNLAHADTQMLHTLVQTHTFFNDHQLPMGNYLMVDAHEDGLAVSAYTKLGFEPTLLHTRRDLAFTVTDTLGRHHRDALVYLDKKKIPFDPKTQCYRLKKQRKGGILSITVAGVTGFYEISKVSHWKHEPKFYFFSTRLGRWLLFPKRKIQYWHRKMRYQDGFRDKAKALFYRERHGQRYPQFSGYAALSQPIYRPGDTLEVKFWLTDEQQRPWKKPITLSISSRQNSNIKRQKIYPQKPGVFLYRLPLKDSLTLDEQYYLRAEAPHIWRPKGCFKRKISGVYQYDTAFKYEDYILDELRYTFTQDKDNYIKGDSIRYRLSAFTTNQQAVPDGYYKLVVKTQSLYSFFPNEMYQPDTIWQKEGYIGASGKIDLVLPPTFLPDAYYQLNATVYFTNSSGELVTNELRTQVKQALPLLDAKLVRGKLVVQWTAPNNAPNAPVKLSIKSTFLEKDSLISLPFSMPIAPEMSQFWLTYNNAIQASLHVGQTYESGAMVKVWAERVKDTVEMMVSNPLRIPVQYRIFRGKHLVTEGVATDSIWRWRTTDRSHDFKIRYAYTWGGETLEDTREVYFMENRLSVLMEVPPQVAPGDMVPVTVTVRNAQNKPVAGADLTAGGYNARFRATPYKLGDISDKLDKKPRIYPKFEIETLDATTTTLPLSERFYTLLELDKIPFYQLRHIGGFEQTQRPTAVVLEMPIPHTLTPWDTTSGFNKEMAPFHANFNKKRPQFSPFIIHNYQKEPIYLIWVNEKLVYYAGVTQQVPYSFYGVEGYQNIRLRTRNGEYTLKDVFMEKGKKYTFSFWGDGKTTQPRKLLQNSTDTSRLFNRAALHWQAQPDTFTVFEQSVLKTTILQLRPNSINGNQYFGNNAHNIQYLEAINARNRGVQYIGPFEGRTALYSLTTSPFSGNNFYFDPGFEYEIMPQRERLYASRWPAGLGALKPIKAPNYLYQLALTPHDIKIPPKPRPAYGFARLDWPKAGMGNLQLVMPKDTLLEGYTLKKANAPMGLFAPHNVQLKGIAPGRYQLVLFAISGNIAKKDIVIRPDTTLCLRLEGTLFAPPQTGESLPDQFNALPDQTFGATLKSKPLTLGQVGWGAAAATITGIATDLSTQEALIGASVKVFKNKNLIKGTITDIDGHFAILVDEGGNYDIEVSYTGYTTTRLDNIIVKTGYENIVDIELSDNAGNLQEVLIMSYKVPLISQDQTSVGQTLTSESIRSLPTRSINTLLGTVAGASSIDDGEVRIKGSRSYGAEYYVDGIRVNSSHLVPVQDIEILGPPVVLRTDFRDLAYFKPLLSTDKQGKAVFNVHFPDDITAWDQYTIAADRKGRAGYTTTQTRAVKSVVAQLAVPRFAIAGDQFDVAGRMTNSTQDSLMVKTRFLMNKALLKEKNHKIGFGMAEFQRVAIPNSTDSVSFGYELQSNNSSDGEQWVIPVLPVGTEENMGDFAALYRDTTLLWNFDAAKGPVTLHIENNSLDFLLQHIETLRNYPYGCNEQTASRLMALLTLKKIKTWQQQPIQLEKEIQACIKRLKSTQNPNGSWGWWQHDATNAWMTIYVAQALSTAVDNNYPVESLHPALAFLRLQLPQLSWYEQADALALLKANQSDKDCTPYLAKADSIARQLTKTNVYDHLIRLKLQQLCGKTIEKHDLDTLLQPTTLGGLYCGEMSSHWYNRRNTNTILAYKIAQKAGWNDIMEGISRYWMHTRQQHYTTFEKALMVEAMLPQMMKQGEIPKPAQVTVNGRILNQFPADLQLPNDQPVSISKSGSLAVYCVAYQTFNNPNPTSRSDIFEVKTQLLDNAGQATTTLKYGESAVLEVNVAVKAVGEYIMIEVPIPAGCTYGQKIQPNYPEVHREYFKDRTAIFCSNLAIGQYTFRIPLESRFSGRFTLNPAKVEQMYFPVFYGRNTVKTVEITK